MTTPLVILAACAILLGFVGTPAWPWFQKFLEGEHVGGLDFSRFSEHGVLPLLLISSAIVFIGIGLGWWFYGRKPMQQSNELDPAEKLRPDIFWLLRKKYLVDEIYEATVIRLNAWFAQVCDILDAFFWGGMVALVSYLTIGLAWVNTAFDNFAINLGFDKTCERVTLGGRLMSQLQDGRVQSYLRVIGIALAALVLLLIWGGAK